MYQLSHMLTEQRSLLSELASTSLLESTVKKITDLPENESPTDSKESTPDIKNQEEEEETRRRTLTAILEKVEGCMSLLEPGRNLIHEGDILELDSVEHSAIQRIHAYLFNDCFMLTSWNPNRRGPMRYKFNKKYDLHSLAVVNVRDTTTVKFAFNLLAFPDTRVFQCSSSNSKKEWLDKFDQVKKARLAQEQIKREGTGTERSPSRTASIESPIGNRKY